MDQTTAVENLVFLTGLLSCDEPTLTLQHNNSIKETISRNSLVGRFISNRACSAMTMKNNVMQLWKLKGDVQSHLVLKNWSQYSRPEEVEIDATVAWILLMGMSIELRDINDLKRIGQLFKGFIDTDLDDCSSSEWICYLRVKIEIYIDKPLPTGFQCPSTIRSPARIQFVYENILDFCYCCGKMGHTVPYCEIRKANADFFTNNPIKYGNYMRVVVARQKVKPHKTQPLPSDRSKHTSPEGNIPIPKGILPLSHICHTINSTQPHHTNQDTAQTPTHSHPHHPCQYPSPDNTHLPLYPLLPLHQHTPSSPHLFSSQVHNEAQDPIFPALAFWTISCPNQHLSTSHYYRH
ncbi:hypothetical protein LINGRAHAP2_LOCUS1916 [Linum grandiflorum]